MKIVGVDVCAGVLVYYDVCVCVMYGFVGDGKWMCACKIWSIGEISHWSINFWQPRTVLGEISRSGVIGLICRTDQAQCSPKQS